MKKSISNICRILLYVLFIIFMIGIIGAKGNFHIDEPFTYGLSNDEDGLAMSFIDGVKYEEPEKPFEEYLTVQEGDGFNYQQVWSNQAKDVHPPLYYALVHTVCSFFPNQFSIWHAGVINVFFGLLTLMTLRKLMDALYVEACVKNVVSIVFICSAVVLSMVSFLRMYIMSMFWVALITWFFVKSVDETWTWKDYLSLYVISVLSALTHYYCVVYLATICIVYGIWLLAGKKWSVLIKFISVMGAAAGTALAVFPAMWGHVFSGYRGTESIENFANTSLEDYLYRLSSFSEIIDSRLLGGAQSILLLAVIVLWVLDKNTCVAKDDSDSKKRRRVKNILIIVPSLVYFVLISKMAVYIEERYVSLIFPIVIMIFIDSINYILNKCLNGNIKNVLLVFIGAIVIVNGWRSAEWGYLYLDSKAFIEDVEKYSDVDCIVIYDEVFKVHTSYWQVANYNSVTFVKADSCEQIKDMELIDNSNLIVVLIGAEENIINSFLDVAPNMSNYKQIGLFGSGISYYLYGQESIEGY